jgi:hypothetical protein
VFLTGAVRMQRSWRQNFARAGGSSLSAHPCHDNANLQQGDSDCYLLPVSMPVFACHAVRAEGKRAVRRDVAQKSYDVFLEEWPWQWPRA